MKLLATLALASTLTSAFAAQEFGGMKFHSSVPLNQIDSIKSDLRYLYQNPVMVRDFDFARLAVMPVVDGPSMHNWLVNRFKYIVGEEFQLNDQSIVGKQGHNFPLSPLPAAFEKSDGVKVVMSNVGTALYLVGKREKMLFGINFDGEMTYFTSPRIGLLQVGEGLFFKEFQISANINSHANSISRLGTLFHEARHSDGNGKNTGFAHDICPALHPYEGHPACELSANGSYTIGALAERQLIQNCNSCSIVEKSTLTAKVADSFHRIINYDSRKQDLQYYMNRLNLLKISYEGLIIGSSPEKKVQIQAEIAKIDEALKALSAIDASLESLKGKKSEVLNAEPEGQWTNVSLTTSKYQMEKSLRKK